MLLLMFIYTQTQAHTNNYPPRRFVGALFIFYIKFVQIILVRAKRSHQRCTYIHKHNREIDFNLTIYKFRHLFAPCRVDIGLYTTDWIASMKCIHIV